MRVLLISDIHSNLEALQAVKEAASFDKFDEVWCAGDITGYGPNPTECIDLFKTAPHIRVVRGNHDAVVARLVPPLSFNHYAINAAKRNLDTITADACMWLAVLQDSLDLHDNIAMFHGGPTNPDEYLLSLQGAVPAFSDMTKLGKKIGIFGHTHIPAFYIYDCKRNLYFEESVTADKEFTIDFKQNAIYLINPGSVGQPRDGDPRASFMEIEISEELVVIKSRRVYYDIAACQEKMQSLGYPNMLINRLSFGC